MRNLRQDNRGIATLLIIIVIVVLVAAGGIGWYVMQKNDPDNSPAARAALSECLSDLNDESLCKFVIKFNTLGAYKANITTSGTRNNVIDIELDGNGNSSMVLKEDGKETSSLIYLDNVSYIKDYTDNSWFKYPVNTSYELMDELKNDVTINFDQSGVSADKRVTYQKAGEEACGDLECLSYEIDNPAEGGRTQKIWFDTKEFKLRRWTKTGWAKTVIGTKTDMIVSYGNISVTAPSPVKEIDAGAPIPNDL